MIRFFTACEAEFFMRKGMPEARAKRTAPHQENPIFTGLNANWALVMIQIPRPARVKLKRPQRITCVFAFAKMPFPDRDKRLFVVDRYFDIAREP